jgi:hypothetical protein
MRQLLPRLSLLLFALFLAGMADTALYLIFDSKSDAVRTLAGERHALVGKLPEAVANVNILPRDSDANKEAERIALLNGKVLDQRCDAAGIAVRFLELRGRIWRGVLTVSEAVQPGRYALTVFPRERLRSDPPSQEPSTVMVTVFADPKARRHSYTALSERYLGVGPWWVVMAIIPLVGLLLLQNFRQSAREDAALQAKGLGTIYKLARNQDHWELLFGLGSRHGVREGESLALLDRAGRQVGLVTARRVGPDSTWGRAGLDAAVEPSHRVSKLPVR